MNSISKEKFDSYNIEKSPAAILFGEEVEWFEDEGKRLLSTIIKDKIDGDWVYVILALDSDNIFRAIEVDASIESKKIALKKMGEQFSELIQEGEFKEGLYEDKNVDNESSNIIITDINEEIKKYLKTHPEKLYDLSPRKFEELVASILTDMGLDVQLTQQTRDGGSDIVAYFKNVIANFLILIECKKYSPENKVGVGVVREVAGVHSFKQPSKSIIVTTSTFTKYAIEEASILKDNLELKDYYDLKEWLAQY